MSEFGFPATGDIVLPVPQSAEPILSLSKQNSLEPTNDELARESNGGIDPWFLEGDNTKLALEKYYLEGDEKHGRAISSALEHTSLIGNLAVRTAENGMFVADTLSSAEAALLRQLTRFSFWVNTYESAPNNAAYRQFMSVNKAPMVPKLTTAEKWKAAVGAVLASSGIAPLLTMMPQMAQMGMFGVAAGGAGLGLSVAKTAWQNAEARKEIAENKEREGAALLQRGEELATLLEPSVRKLLDGTAMFVPGEKISINLKDLKKQLRSNESYAQVIDSQLNSIDPPTEDEKYDMQEQTWGPALDVVDKAADYGVRSISQEDIDRALQALHDGRKNRKKRKHTLDFHPAEAVTAMLAGIHHTNPEYLLRAWHGAEKPGIKQHVQRIASLHAELHRGDTELKRIQRINDGMQYEHNGDKVTERRYADMRREKETALHITVLEFIKFGQDVTNYLLSQVYEKKPTTPRWEQPKTDEPLTK